MSVESQWSPDPGTYREEVEFNREQFLGMLGDVEEQLELNTAERMLIVFFDVLGGFTWEQVRAESPDLAEQYVEAMRSAFGVL